MRILFVHPNDRSGGAESAGTWPPAWVANLTGALRKAGFEQIDFIDAITNNLTDQQLTEQMATLRPDVVGVTAITPSIYVAQAASVPLCHWHAAVFERLFRVPVDGRLRATGTRCCACGAEACRFELRV